MKKLILVFVISTLSLTALAESVSCISNEGDWVVSLDLDSSRGSNIEIRRHQVLVAKFSETKVNSYRFPRQILNYEIDLAPGKYLYIYRDMNGKVPLKTGSAVFYLAKHPFAFEKHAENCTFSD